MPFRSDPAMPRRLMAVCSAMLLAAPLPWAVIYLMAPLNHDVAAVLHFAERWLGGEALYRDLIDMNPPLIFILTLIPAVLGKATPLGGPVAVVLCTFAYLALSFALAWRLLRSGWSEATTARWMLPPLLLFLLVVCPGQAFAQREHLMIASLLPYLLLADLRVRAVPVGLRMRWTVALFAALGLAIKPHFLIFPLLIEVYVLIRRGLRPILVDAVPWVMLGAFALYALFVLLAMPEYLDFVVPLAEHNYLQLGLGPWNVLRHSQLTIPTALFLPLALLAFVLRCSDLARLVALAGIGSILQAVAQGKGWPYHVLPTETCLLLLAGILLCDLLDRFHPRQFRTWTMAAVAGFVMACYMLAIAIRPTFYFREEFKDGRAAALLAEVRKHAAGEPVLVLSPGVYPFFPVLNYTGSTMATRFMTMWVLQGAYAECEPGAPRYREPGEMGAAEAYVYEAVAADIHRFRPRLLIVDRYPGIPVCDGRDFNFLDFFRQHPLFEANWERYLYIGNLDGELFLYLRQGD